MAELMLKDLESLEKRIPKVERDIKINQNKPKELKEATEELALLKQVMQALNNGDANAARALIQNAIIPTIPLLSTKNFLIIANIAEHELENDGYRNNPHYQAVLQRFGKELVIPVSAKVEYELSLLPDTESKEMMNMLGLKEKSLDTIIRQTYKALGLITFFTCGPKEAHAWPLRTGTSVRAAAGEIHSDLERGFICADVFNCSDIFELKSEAAIKDKGRMRREGQEYIVQDGDLLNIKFNV